MSVMQRVEGGGKRGSQEMGQGRKWKHEPNVPTAVFFGVCVG